VGYGGVALACYYQVCIHHLVSSNPIRFDPFIGFP
jgi:hypothetical protein